MNEPSGIGAPPAVEELNYESNPALGLIGGIAAMLISAALWGFLTFILEIQISWMAIGVGFLVGFAVNKLGKGNTMIYGIIGAGLSLLGCMLGNLFFYSGVLAREYDVPFFNVLINLSLQPDMIIEIFIAAFEIMDMLFYLIAIYVGFVTATKQIKAPTKHWSENS